MKKSLEKELMALAEKILQMKNRADVHELKVMTAILYEKLSVLSFAEKHFEGAQPSLTKKHLEDALVERTESYGAKENLHQEKDENRYSPDGTQYNPEGITEPNTEKIKDIVAQMPPESEQVDEVLSDLLPDENSIKSFQNFGVHYDDLPQFDPLGSSREIKEEKKVQEEQKEPEKSENNVSPKETTAPKKTHLEQGEDEQAAAPSGNTALNGTKDSKPNSTPPKKSLNDHLRKGVSFGLNDRLVFVRHLFEGNGVDYDRVISQLNTFSNYKEANDFIHAVVKPDYNNWIGKEQYEKRFLKALKNKFD